MAARENSAAKESSKRKSPSKKENGSAKENKADSSSKAASSNKKQSAAKSAIKKGAEKNPSKAEAKSASKQAPTVSNRRFSFLGNAADGKMQKSLNCDTEDESEYYADSLEEPKTSRVKFNDQIYHRVVEEPHFQSVVFSSVVWYFILV